jgi:hypothetical protein
MSTRGYQAHREACPVCRRTIAVSQDRIGRHNKASAHYHFRRHNSPETGRPCGGSVGQWSIAIIEANRVGKR